MHSIAALLTCAENQSWQQTYAGLRQCGMITSVAMAVSADAVTAPADVTLLRVSGFWSKQAVLHMLQWYGHSGADHLLICAPGPHRIDPEGLQRMVASMADTGSSIVYGDYHERHQDGSATIHPLIDYQPGSIRDTFDFGPVFLVNGPFVAGIRGEFSKTTPDLVYGGLYDLRLRLSACAPFCHIPEPLYATVIDDGGPGSSAHFAYVDPRNRAVQQEMETVATAHLQRIGARITAPGEKPLIETGDFPVTASVIIPVKNRDRTIGDAVTSALSQKTTFAYNVIVIDNHSTDGTTAILAEIARHDARLIHRIPEQTDLLIGGCWNEAIYADLCGRYAVQLDSDDLYSGTNVLERIVAEFGKKPYALVIGSYTTVDFDCKPRAPGLVDHREWTDANGPNNALRIPGLGAPRSYHVPTLRQFGFPNVSYGEDYAVVVRLCRSYPVGRIYESLYWCRRWEENSDSALPLEKSNQYDLYKDTLRTVEIEARIRREDCR